MGRRLPGNSPVTQYRGNTPSSLYALPEPSDEEIVAYAREHYSQKMAEQVYAALRSSDAFGAHVRRSFIREMREPVK